MDHLPFFLNPTARSARAGKLRRWLSRHPDRFNVVEPNSPEQLQELLRQHVDAGTPTVAIGGGDGTLSVAASILQGSQTKLAVFPSGTANVFALELGLSTGDYDSAWEVMEQGVTRTIDLFQVNGKPFVQMAGVGFDARAVELTTWELKKKWGPLAYVWSGLRALREDLPQLELSLPSGEKIKAHTVLFGNGRYYGGPLPLFGLADPSDHLLDIIAFDSPIPQALMCICKGLLQGGLTMTSSNHFRYIQAESCQVAPLGNASVAVERDGDFSGYAPISISRSSRALEVYVPRHQED